MDLWVSFFEQLQILIWKTVCVEKRFPPAGGPSCRGVGSSDLLPAMQKASGFGNKWIRFAYRLEASTVK